MPPCWGPGVNQRDSGHRACSNWRGHWKEQFRVQWHLPQRHRKILFGQIHRKILLEWPEQQRGQKPEPESESESEWNGVCSLAPELRNRDPADVQSPDAN